MNSRTEKERQKQTQDKCQLILNQLLREEDNKYCVDCDAKGPRWASWNLGIFLCIRCAGIHRNLGVHISKVKSVNLDTWNPDQVAYLQNMGNSQARAIYEANLPDNFRRPQTDSSLESFIRAKYETKKYIAKEWVPGPTPKPAFDIEDEWKKEKERRKLKKLVPSQPASVPRPQGASVSPSPPKPPRAHAVKPKVESNVDLLGLDLPASNNTVQPALTSNDIFNDFLSSAPVDNTPIKAPSPVHFEPKTAANRPEDSNLKSEEENFFNQTTEKKTVLMSKESILSLYGTAPLPAVKPQPQPQQQLFQGIPQGGMYLNQAPTMFQGMGPNTGFPNGMMPTQQNPSAMNQPLSGQQTNPFLGMGPNQSTWGPVNNGLASNVNQIQNQVASLQLGGSGTAAQNWTMGKPQTVDPQAYWQQTQNHTVSSNLWQ